MKVVMLGTGYVGLVTGTCFADSGNDVTCVDINQQKIDMLNRGEVPIYEPGLAEMVRRNAASGRLQFTTDLRGPVAEADCVFVAVGTPQGDDGSADLSYVFGAAEAIAPHLREDAIVVVKSTVPVGTNRAVFGRLKELTGRDVHVASNPEFLKEGCAIDDFTKPDRVVVGVMDKKVGEVLAQLYAPFLRTEQPFLVMGLESAEMTKYVANCMLATKISFINEMANLCDRVGADINEVRRGIGHDQRIGFSFLFPGVGYGGSCFPKDVRAMISVADTRGMDAEILKAVDEVNNRQKHVLFAKLDEHFGGDLKGKKIAVWGLSFKPRTDDIREAPSLVLIEQLLAGGADIHVHDPVAVENVKAQLGDKLTYHEHHYDALEGVDALAIVTEWNEYRNPDFEYVKHKMGTPVIFDGRNLYDPEKMGAAGFTYSGIGLKSPGRR
ncbi:UDP-glucose 6-dehydrogenase [Maioricimonas rarisocia]|uniref:UDP-glucose 6-dehydrogenase n=1 Tax=Maioricimonas rarisocia TaxID=2528026 RepID=A0A517Z3L0_9PLAN|nr:UDP-glucose/GDP-mannose dehydrogenase family protein [Maioricimonas rarisocia]QDU37036.1 UDP-glucose 6-dehydrogenase [Maioricimonas rarisocia]